MGNPYDPKNNGYDPAIYGGPLSDVLVINMNPSPLKNDEGSTKYNTYDPRIHGKPLSDVLVINYNYRYLKNASDFPVDVSPREMSSIDILKLGLF